MIHITINHRIVHRVRHRKPVNHQVDLLYVDAVVNFWIDVCRDEVSMIRQPADNEDEHNHHHHFYNLKLEQYFNKTGQQGGTRTRQKKREKNSNVGKNSRL